MQNFNKEGLKPCPFCDEPHKATIVEFNNPDGLCFEVMCCFCGTTTRMFATKELAAAFWNTRNNADAALVRPATNQVG